MGTPPSHASAPRAAGEEAPPPRVVPTRAMRGPRSHRPPSAGTSGTRRHTPRAFSLPPRNPPRSVRNKKTSPPKPTQKPKAKRTKAAGAGQAGVGRGGRRGGGAAGGTHRGHEAVRPAADTIWQRGDVSGSSCSLRSGGGTALPLPMATASKLGPPAAASSPAAFPRSRPPPAPAPPPAPPPRARRGRAGSASRPQHPRRLGKVLLSPPPKK